VFFFFFPANPTNLEVCEKDLIDKGSHGGMTCESL